MVNISSDNNKINVQVSSTTNKNNIPLGVTYNYYDNIAKQWAISEKYINNEDYSSKHYAQESKKQAVFAENQAKIATEMVEEIRTNGQEILSNVTEAEENALDNIQEQKALSIKNITNTTSEQITKITQEGNKQVNLATTQAEIATQKVQEVIDKGNEALSNIATQENLSKNSVVAEGDKQVERIKTETKDFATKAEAKYTAGSGIAINNNVISNTQSSAKWGNILGEITSQTDLVEYIKNNIPDINNYQINNVYSLFDCKFADHKLDNLSWLRSEGQYNNGSIYTAGYNELLSEYNNTISQEETENEITFKRTPKGYKIALSTQKDTIDSLYNSTGVAWFYILDIENQQFILPRTKYGFSGTRNNVGDYIAESLPNIKGSFGSGGSSYGSVVYNYTGAFVQNNKGGGTSVNAAASGQNHGANFDASAYSDTYQDNAPVQERSTQMYLYFYIGETLQNANLVNIAKIQEELVSINATKRAYLIDSYVNGTSWYRVFSDGWCEQGGRINITAESKNVQIVFTKTYTSIPNIVTTVSSDNAYSSNTGSGNLNSINTRAGGINQPTTTGFYFNYLNKSSNSGTGDTMWRACGYIK